MYVAAGKILQPDNLSALFEMCTSYVFKFSTITIDFVSCCYVGMVLAHVVVHVLMYRLVLAHVVVYVASVRLILVHVLLWTEKRFFWCVIC